MFAEVVVCITVTFTHYGSCIATRVDRLDYSQDSLDYLRIFTADKPEKSVEIPHGLSLQCNMIRYFM